MLKGVKIRSITRYAIKTYNPMEKADRAVPKKSLKLKTFFKRNKTPIVKPAIESPKPILKTTKFKISGGIEIT